MAKTIKLDVRELPPYQRHPLIFETWEALEVGDTMELINDHDPRPLHYQFMMEREGEFEWDSKEKSPLEWVAHIKKVGLPKAATL
ncbi:MAG: DUF2249 domain-containing protein [Armatimonadota bacterium]|nr:DUF2249 domain-containing protein [Armatimonadota bacterium]